MRRRKKKLGNKSLGRVKEREREREKERERERQRVTAKNRLSRHRIARSTFPDLKEKVAVLMVFWDCLGMIGLLYS